MDFWDKITQHADSALSKWDIFQRGRENRKNQKTQQDINFESQRVDLARERKKLNEIDWKPFAIVGLVAVALLAVFKR